MKKIINLVVLLMLLGASVSAQSNLPWVLASAGDFSVNSTNSLSWTFGEMTMVETVSNSTNMLTQGFQQPFDFGSFVYTPPAELNKFNAFPNPSDGNFKVNYQLGEAGKLTFKIYDVLGQMIYLKSVTQVRGINMTDINLAVSQGMYFLESTFEGNSGKKIVSNQKINIVY